MPTRSSFLFGAACLAGAGLPALATGGRDVEGPVLGHEIRVLLASDSLSAGSARVVDDHSFQWNGRNYRGRFETVALADGRTGLVAVVPLDAYLYGVVSKEIPSGWSRSALEAQAIVARTYALGKQRPGKPYDVLAGESDQVYGAVEAETIQARDAVDATAGSVLVYADQPAKVAYGACCGGHTADAAELWGAAYPYLRGVADPHCSGAPEFRWQRVVPYDQFVRAFGSAMDDAGDLDRVELRDLDSSGRPRRLALIGDRGQYEVKLGTFRSTLGTTVVRSTLVQSVNVARGDTVTIAGSGHGHGAGLCQWGSRYLAQDGANALQIVTFYFPGTSLGNA